MDKIALGIFSHPDDAELMCIGTLSLLKKAGWKIHIATMTPGDKGSAEHTRAEISASRKNEAAQAAALLCELLPAGHAPQPRPPRYPGAGVPGPLGGADQ